MIKKQLIMEKALELFAENGIEATSIQQITERCGISKGAFYLSYKSKNELILGLIDSFMSEIVADIEQSVNSNRTNEELLYHFYHTTFQAYQRHADFAKIFIKEPFASCDLELLKELNKYNECINDIIFSLVKLHFPKMDESMHADLVYVIKGFMKHYAEMFFIYNVPVDLDTLCNSLVEKTSIIAEHATLPIISPDFLSYPNAELIPFTKEQLINTLTQKMNEVTDSIIQQSLELLKKDLDDPQLPPAVMQGLLRNLRTDSHSKWAAYLYELYLKHEDTCPDTKRMM